MLVCRHPGPFFRVHPASQEKNYHSEMEKIALTPICNIIVTKKISSGMKIKKKFFDTHVSCRHGRVTANQYIFKSGLKYIIAMYKDDLVITT